MSDNDFTSRLGFEVDQASIERAKAALTTVTKAVEKAADDVIRANDLDKVAREYAKIAVEGEGAVNVTNDLVRELALLGASEREIDRTVKAFDRQVDAIKKSDAAAAKKAANDADRAQDAIRRERELLEIEARKENARRDAERRPQSQLDRFEQVEGTSGKIGDVGDAAAALGSATGITALSDFGAIFEGIEALARLKQGLQALPESFAATAQAVGLVKAAQDAATVATTAGAAADTASASASTGAAAAETAQATASTALAASSGAASIGIGTMLLALGPIAAVLAGIAIGAKLVADQLKGANEDLKAAYDAQREIQEFIRSGATSGDAKARLDEIQRVLDDERTNLANAKADYAEAFNAAANSIPIIGDLFARIADLFGAFSSTRGEIDEATKTVKENEKEQGALNKALEENKFAAADAAQAQTEAAKATTQAAAATSKSTTQQITQEASAYQYEEQLLAQHLANEGALKGQAYNQQIQMVQEAAASVQNGYRPLNMSGARGGTMSGFSIGGLRPIQNAPYVRRDGMGNARPNVGTLNISTNADPNQVIKVLTDVGLVG
jgi:hypothetical protein